MSEGVSLYKSFIEGLISCRAPVEVTRIRNGSWHRSPPPDQVRFNEILGRLSPQDRETLAELCQSACDSVLHDVLVYIGEQGFHLSKDGVSLPVEPFGTGPNWDYLERVAGEPWPDERP